MNKSIIVSILCIINTPFSSANASNDSIVNGAFVAPVPSEMCLQGLIEPGGTDFNALQSSLFSSTLYEQGDGDWKPTEVTFYVRDTQGNAIPGCEVDFSTDSINDGVFYPINSVSDKEGKVSGWWVSGSSTDPELVARLKDASHISASISGTVSAKSHRNLAPATYLGFGSLTDRWSEFNIDLTPTSSTKATYFKAIGWSGGYAGIQQTDDGEPKKLIFSVWKSDYGMAELIEGPADLCKTNTDSAEGDFVQCFLDYPWEVGNTYTFNMTAKHNVSNAIDYELLVTDKAHDVTKNIATIRVPQESDDFYPATPSAFIEQFAYDQYSCSEIVQRSAIYSSLWKVNPETGKKEDITSAIFSRPYDPSYGHGSLCFNYAYGSVESLPYNSTDIKEGFYLSTGGNSLISRPADGAVGVNLLDIGLHLKYYVINKQDELNKLDTYGSYLNSLLRNKNFISVETDDGNWLPFLYLPEYAIEGNKIKLEVRSSYDVSVVNGENTDVVTTNDSRSYIYYRGAWVLSDNGDGIPDNRALDISTARL